MRAQIRIIAAAVAALMVCLLFFFFFIRPRQSEITTIEGEITSARAEQQNLTLQLERLEELKENAPELNATLEQIRGFVPKDSEVPNFIFQVQDAANSAGVSFVKITPELPKPPAAPAPLAEMRISISATGRFFSLQDFTRRLYSLDRALRIDTMSLAAEGAAAAGSGQDNNVTSTTTSTVEGELTLTMAARIFFEHEGAVGGTAPAPTETTVPTTEETPAPGATETTAPTSPAP